MGFAPSPMQVRSPAFQNHERIPKKHTGEGEDAFPAIEWTDAPAEARSFAVLCHDPDAPLCKPGSYGYVHWIAYNIPGDVTSLAEGDAERFTTGRNDFGRTDWGGPMPPEGHGRHHYYFWVFALDRELDLEPGLTMEQLLERIEPHVIGMNRLVGTYERG